MMARLGEHEKAGKTEPRACITRIQIFPSYAIHRLDVCSQRCSAATIKINSTWFGNLSLTPTLRPSTRPFQCYSDALFPATRPRRNLHRLAESVPSLTNPPDLVTFPRLLHKPKPLI